MFQTDVLDAPSPADFSVLGPPLDAPFRVLVFPSVNEPGLEIIQALARSNKIELFGGSSFGTAWDPSRLWVHRHLDCPALHEPDFRARFEALLAEHEIDVVFPTTDALVAEFASWEESPSRLVTTGLEAATVCLSKRLTYNRLRGLVPVPDIYDEDADVVFPAYAKPDEGSGSRGTSELRDLDAVPLARAAGLLVHQYLPGPEYTVDCLSDMDGRLMVSNVRVRGHIGRGISLGTAAVDRPEINDYVAAIAADLRVRGPWFAQFKEDVNGHPRVLEVNARVAGSMVLTRLAGVNIPLITAFMFAGWAVRVPRRLSGSRVLRHLRTLGEVSDFDWAIWDLDDTIVRPDGKPDPDAVSRLYDLQNQGKQQLLLTRNVDPLGLIERLRLPSLFVAVHQVTDKIATLPGILQQYGIDPAACVFINDSVSENLAIQDLFPTLRTIMPDALDVLAREKVK